MIWGYPYFWKRPYTRIEGVNGTEMCKDFIGYLSMRRPLPGCGFEPSLSTVNSEVDTNLSHCYARETEGFFFALFAPSFLRRSISFSLKIPESLTDEKPGYKTFSWPATHCAKPSLLSETGFSKANTLRKTVVLRKLQEEKLWRDLSLTESDPVRYSQEYRTNILLKHSFFEV